MKFSDFQTQALRSVRSYIKDRAPDLQLEEKEVSNKDRSYFVLKVTSNTHRVDIYIYDDGDLGFKTEDDKWFPLELWDEKDERKRIERFIKMLEKHVAILGITDQRSNL